MSRMPGGETIIVRPTNNVYTVLVAVAIVANIIAIILLFMRAGELFGPGGLLGK